MAIVNLYRFNNGSGATLTDFKGAANGTITGATWSSKGNYLKFVGGNGATAGDRNRVLFTQTSFQYAYNNANSMSIWFKSVKSDANVHSLFAIGNSGTSYEGIRLSLGAAEGATAKYITNISAASKEKSTNDFGAYCDGLWHNFTMTYASNVAKFYIDGKYFAPTTNDSFTSGNFYSATTRCLLGCLYNGTAYILDCTADISKFMNVNSELTPAQIANEVNEFNLIY